MFNTLFPLWDKPNMPWVDYPVGEELFQPVGPGSLVGSTFANILFAVLIGLVVVIILGRVYGVESTIFYFGSFITWATVICFSELSLFSIPVRNIDYQMSKSQPSVDKMAEKLESEYGITNLDIKLLAKEATFKEDGEFFAGALNFDTDEELAQKVRIIDVKKISPAEKAVFHEEVNRWRSSDE